MVKSRDHVGEYVKVKVLNTIDSNSIKIRRCLLSLISSPVNLLKFEVIDRYRILLYRKFLLF